MFQIRLEVTDDLIFHLRVIVMAAQRNGCAEGHGLPRKLGEVDDFGARKLVLQIHHAALDEGLTVLGGMIFGVLRKITMGARLRDHLDDGVALDSFQLLEFVLQGLVAGSRHGNAFHPVHL